MKSADKFYSERDLRTVEYVGSDKLLNSPVFIAVGEKVLESKVGQIFLLSLLNQVCRVHRKVTVKDFSGQIKLLAKGLFLSDDLKSEVIKTMNTVDPFGEHLFAEVNSEEDIVLAVGVPDYQNCIYVGYEGAIATISDKWLGVDCESEGSARGACLAACLGASSIFQKALYGKFPKFNLSIWNLKQGSDAAVGPSSMNHDLPKKILMVGGGAIGSGAGYWCRVLEKEADWALVEKDVVKLHNTNRGLLFFPKDTDFFGNEALSKAAAISSYVANVKSYENWLHEVRLENESFDAVLCFANEYGVRRLVNFISSPIIFQATTGKSWLSQLHRHIIGKDDCVFCRTGEIKPVKFGCSTVELQDANTQSDAALPFLSALSSLALVVALEQIQTISETPINDWRMDLKSEFRQVSYGKRKCKQDCDINSFASATEPYPQTDLDLKL